MNNTLNKVIQEIQKAIVGKQEVVEKMLMAILAGGHILLDDVPGVGKTTMAIAFGKALGLQYQRVQFTPDVLPSDIVGFSYYNKLSGQFEYMPGVVTRANLLLGDEINRTSSKTQSALLEAMEERQVTVDGHTYPLLDPFTVIATQNHVGTAGTQLLPYAQLDRFLVRLTIGYPSPESQMAMIRDRQQKDPLDSVQQACDAVGVRKMQEQTQKVHLDEHLIRYITDLAETSRQHPMLALGISPRGALSLSRMAKACAYLRGRDYVIPEDIRDVFADVCTHRLILNQKAKIENATDREILDQILKETRVPDGQGAE